MSVSGVIRAAHYSVIGSMGVVIGAALLAALAGTNSPEAGTTGGWEQSFVTISAFTGYSDRAGVGIAAMVYYAIVPLIAPLIAFSVFVYCMYEVDGRQKAWISRHRAAAERAASGVLGALVCISGLIILGTFKGQDARLLSLSGTYWAMALKGWVPFAAAGALIGSGLVFLRRSYN